jgi:hypothetical protein
MSSARALDNGNCFLEVAISDLQQNSGQCAIYVTARLQPTLEPHAGQNVVGISGSNLETMLPRVVVVVSGARASDDVRCMYPECRVWGKLAKQLAINYVRLQVPLRDVFCRKQKRGRIYESLTDC